MKAKILSLLVWDDNQKLRLKIGLMLVCVPIFAWAILALYFYILMELNFSFLSASFPGAVEALRTKFDDFWGEKFFFYLSVFGSQLLLNLFLGLHISARLVRPFRRMASFCTGALTSKSVGYEPDFFSDFKFLTSFTDYFFSHLQKCRQTGVWTNQTIPPHYAKVRGPVFERSYFLSIFVLMSILTGIAIIYLYFLTVDLQSDLVSLSITVANQHGSSEIFIIKDQTHILNTVLYFATGILLFIYAILTVYFYQLASDAAFAFFATFRAFIKGQTHSRVHLLGHGHLRSYGREVNAYLKTVEQELFGPHESDTENSSSSSSEVA